MECSFFDLFISFQSLFFVSFISFIEFSFLNLFKLFQLILSLPFIFTEYSLFNLFKSFQFTVPFSSFTNPLINNLASFLILGISLIFFIG